MTKCEISYKAHTIQISRVCSQAVNGFAWVWTIKETGAESFGKFYREDWCREEAMRAIDKATA